MIANSDLQFLGRAGVNYLLSPGGETGALGWSLFTTTWSSNVPTTITGGAANCTLTSSTTTPLRGTRSLQFAVTTAAGSAGQGFITDTFTIDDADLAKVLSAAFDYRFSAGGTSVDVSGTSTETLEIWVYNVGLAAWSQPAGYRGINQNSGPGYVAATFQTDSSNASSKNQYRLAVIIKNAPTGTFTMQLDQATVGPQTVQYGAPVTDWQSYTLTIGATTTTAPTLGAVSVNSAKWRRVGDSAEIQYNLVTTTGGTTGSGTYLFPLPSGLSLDSSKIGLSTGADSLYLVGSSSVSSPGSTNDSLGFIKPYNSTNLAVLVVNDASTPAFLGSSYYALDNASGRSYTFTARVPILGWSSTVQMSNDTDTRVVTATLGSGTATLSASFSDVSFTAVSDTHGAFSGSTYTVPVSGFYALEVEGRFSSSGAITATNAIGFQFLVDGSSVKDGSDAFLSTTAQWSRLFHEVYLKSGQLIKVQAKNQNASPTFGVAPTFNVKRLSGPSAIAATETVAGRWLNTAGTGVTTNIASYPAAVIPFASVDSSAFDTHGMASGSGTTWKVTAPVSGKYILTANMEVASGAGALSFQFYKNGTTVVSWFRSYESGTNTTWISGSSTVSLSAGDYIQILAATSVAQTLGTPVGQNVFTMTRVGN